MEFQRRRGESQRILSFLSHIVCRDIFYKDVQLFERQATVNKVINLQIFCEIGESHRTLQLVDDIAATIGTDRADLHVVGG